MAALAPIAQPPSVRRESPPSPPQDARPLLTGFVGGGLAPTGAHRLATLAASGLIHTLLVLAIIVVPLLFFEDILPVPGDALRAFFVAPPESAPPPPPPPPAPPAGARAVSRAPAAARLSEAPKFVAPVDVPEVLPEMEESLDLGGVEGGVPGGVEGGVPGGVVGGIVGGLPSEPAPPPRVVRIGGKVIAPKLVDMVRPEYPSLAREARLKGVVILEARVGLDGRVKEVRPLRGPPLLVDAAMEAVRKWRYKPYLLNGAPVEFILTVTVTFSLTEAVTTQ